MKLNSNNKVLKSQMLTENNLLLTKSTIYIIRRRYEHEADKL